MSCSQTLSGIAKDCTPSKGGIVEVYIANADDVTAVTLTDNKVSAITMASSAKFKKYQFARNTGSMSSNYQIDNAAGTTYVQTDLVLQFNRMETSKRVEISALAVNELAVMVKDANGLYWYLGEGINTMDEPVVASAGDGLTGTARADRNGYSVTLQANTQEMPCEILVGTGGVDLDTLVG